MSGALEVHIERKQANGKAYIPNNADVAKQDLNFHIVADMEERKLHIEKTPLESLQERIDKRIAEGHTCGRKVRPDAVKSLNLILSGSKEGFANMSYVDVQKWACAAFNWAAKEFGGYANIVGFAVHMDETTPHIHCTIVPINGNRLQAKSFIGSPAKLASLQTSFAKAMEPYGFERGEHYTHKEEMPRHCSTKEYYQAYQQLTAVELQQIEERAQAVRERLIKELVLQKIEQHKQQGMEPKFHPEQRHQRKDRLHRKI